MILLHLLIKAVCFVLFCLASVFTFMFGKNCSDMKSRYFVTAVYLLGVIVFV